MPRSRPQFSLNNSESVAQNVADIYTQLQSPAQLAAQKASLDASVRSNQPRQAASLTRVSNVQDVVDQFGNVVGRGFVGSDAITPLTLDGGNGDSYGTAKSKANSAVYQATLNPQQLVSGITQSIKPGQVSNAYINPTAQGEYETKPVFNWDGSIAYVYGANSSNPPSSSQTMEDLQRGVLNEYKNYNDASRQLIPLSQEVAAREQALIDSRLTERAKFLKANESRRSPATQAALEKTSTRNLADREASLGQWILELAEPILRPIHPVRLLGASDGSGYSSETGYDSSQNSSLLQDYLPSALKL